MFWFFLIFCLFDGRHWWKNHTQLKRTAEKLKETHAHQKRAGSALSQERTLELRQWCTTSRECLFGLDKGRKVNRRKLNHRKRDPTVLGSVLLDIFTYLRTVICFMVPGVNVVKRKLYFHVPLPTVTFKVKNSPLTIQCRNEINLHCSQCTHYLLTYLLHGAQSFLRS